MGDIISGWLIELMYLIFSALAVYLLATTTANKNFNDIDVYTILIERYRASDYNYKVFIHTFGVF